MPLTSSDCGNIPVLLEFEVDGANGRDRFLANAPKLQFLRMRSENVSKFRVTWCRVYKTTFTL